MAGGFSSGAEGGRGGDAGRTFQWPGRSLGMLRKAEEGAGPLGSTETGRGVEGGRGGWGVLPTHPRLELGAWARESFLSRQGPGAGGGWGRPREGPIPRVTMGAGPTGSVFEGSRKRGGARGTAPLATGLEAGGRPRRAEPGRAGRPATFRQSLGAGLGAGLGPSPEAEGRARRRALRRGRGQAEAVEFPVDRREGDGRSSD